MNASECIICEDPVSRNRALQLNHPRLIFLGVRGEIVAMVAPVYTYSNYNEAGGVSSALTRLLTLCIAEMLSSICVEQAPKVCGSIAQPASHNLYLLSAGYQALGMVFLLLWLGKLLTDCSCFI